MRGRRQNNNTGNNRPQRSNIHGEVCEDKYVDEGMYRDSDPNPTIKSFPLAGDENFTTFKEEKERKEKHLKNSRTLFPPPIIENGFVKEDDRTRRIKFIVKIMNFVIGIGILLVVILVYFFIFHYSIQYYYTITLSTGDFGFTVSLVDYGGAANQGGMNYDAVSSCGVQFSYWNRNNFSASFTKFEFVDYGKCRRIDYHEMLVGDYFLSHSEFYDDGNGDLSIDNKNRSIYIPFKLTRKRMEFNSLEYWGKLLPVAFSIYGKTREGFLFDHKVPSGLPLVYGHYTFTFSIWSWSVISAVFDDGNLIIESFELRYFIHLPSAYILYKGTEYKLNNPFVTSHGVAKYSKDRNGQIEKNKRVFETILEYKDVFKFNMTCWADENLFLNYKDTYTTVLGECIVFEALENKTFRNKGDALLEKKGNIQLY